MGHGGLHPEDGFPTKNGFCDCSGFVSWVIGVSRFQGDKDKPWSRSIPWIETTLIYNDATGPQRMFKQIPSPVPGCFVVYPDRKVLKVHVEGHIALVTRVNGTQFDVIDCSSSKGGKVKEAIREWDRTALFMSRNAIFVVLKEDLAA